MVRALSWNVQGLEFEPQWKIVFFFFNFITVFIFMFDYFHIGYSYFNEVVIITYMFFF